MLHFHFKSKFAYSLPPEVPGSNLGPNIEYPKWTCWWISLASPYRWQIYLKSGRKNFHVSSTLFFINHHITQRYIFWATGSVVKWTHTKCRSQSIRKQCVINYEWINISPNVTAAKITARVPKECTRIFLYECVSLSLISGCQICFFYLLDCLFLINYLLKTQIFYSETSKSIFLLWPLLAFQSFEWALGWWLREVIC
jgi:hypothetical protein